MIKLGQHFLKNKKKIQKIAEALELKDGDTVIEIGPGHGELTSELVKWLISKNIKVNIIAIEKDKELAKNLEIRSQELGWQNIQIIEGDALKILPDLTNNLRPITNNYKLVGNIPYYITGYLLRILGELKNKPSLIVLLIQKEVAERACSKLPRMNLLAASAQFWAELKIIGYVSKKYFWPQPKVDSAIIKLTIHNLQPTTEEAENYYKLIKILFKQPRKTILNNLRPIINDLQLLTEKLKLVGVNPQARPQDLSIEQIIELSTLF